MYRGTVQTVHLWKGPNTPRNQTDTKLSTELLPCDIELLRD